MSANAPRLAYVVPTYNRPDDLRLLFESLVAQTDAPDQIIVVDASDAPADGLSADFPQLAVDWVRVRPPSLARQRNLGMAAVRADIDVAGYLDDDLELEPEATARMRRFWSQAGDEVGGAAFAITNQRVAAGRLDRLFGHSGSSPGAVLRSGFAVSIPFFTETTRTEWLYGGATMWRRRVIDAFQYDEWYIGHGYLEDVDFSYRVSRRFALYVVGDARTAHWHRPMRPDRMTAFGRQQIVNRLYFIRKMRSFSTPAIVWGLIGVFVVNLYAAIRTGDRGGLKRFAGNLRGLAQALRDPRRTAPGHWK